MRALCIFLFCLCLPFTGHAAALDDLAGQWYFDLDKMLEQHPALCETMRSSEGIPFMTVDAAAKQIVLGNGPNMETPEKFSLAGQTAGSVDLQTSKELLRLEKTGDKRAQMFEVSKAGKKTDGFILYLRRDAHNPCPPKNALRE